MTDTTDINALRERLVSLNKTYDLISSPATMEQANTSAHMFVKAGGIHRIIAALNQIEAERQRADEVERLREELLVERNAAINLSNHLSDCAGKLRAANAEIAALKGDQVPVFLKQTGIGSNGCQGSYKEYVTIDESEYEENPVKHLKLFTAPQKPVVNMNHIGRITAQISGQRYTYLSAEDVRHCFEEIKCQIAERTTPASNTVYVPQQVTQKLVVHRSDFESYYSGIMGTPMSVLKVLRNGDSYSATEGERLSLAWSAYQAAIEAAGGVVKDADHEPD